MNTSDWVAVAALAVSLFAAAQAFMSRRVSHRALAATLRQEQRAQSPLEVYLADAYIYRVRPQRRRVYVFRVVITNTADLANSVKAVDLEIRYHRGASVSSNVAVPHGVVAAESGIERPQVLALPLSLPPRGVVSGAAVFDVSDDVLAGCDVDSYRLRVADGLGQSTEVEAILLQEREHAESVAPSNADSPERT